MVSAVQILEPESVTACPWRGSSVDPGDNAGAKHNVGSGPVVEAAREASNVGDDSAADDQDGLVPGHPALLQVHQDSLHILHLFVDLIAGVDQLGQTDLVGLDKYV